MENKKKNLNFEKKLDDFFEMYNLVLIVGEDDIKDDNFINNDDINTLLA